YVLMVAARSLFGLFGSASVPAAQAYIADRTAPTQRVTQLATLGAALGIGVTIGPGVVATLLGLGLVAPFYAVAILAGISALAVAVFLPEGGQQQRSRASQQARMSP